MNLIFNNQRLVIPSCILFIIFSLISGDVWAMQWGNIFDLCKPYSDVPGYQIDMKMKEMNLTVHDLFELADDFYISLGE